MTTTSPSLRCLVTGASRGIGAAIVADLDHAGHRLALTARTEASLRAVADSLAGAGGSPLVLPEDATDPGSAERLHEAITAAWGGIDVLVVNAGEGKAAPLAKTDDAMWQASLDVNLTAPFRLLRAFVPGMVERGFGRVVVVASVAAKVGAPYISAYAAAKHGVLGLVRSVAVEVATSGVTVNAVCPGWIGTDAAMRSLKVMADANGRSDSAELAAILANQAIPELLTPADLGGTFLFLGSPLAAALTGQALSVSHGEVMH